MNTILCLVIASLITTGPAYAQAPSSAVETPQGVVRELYRLVCVDKGGPPTDWDAVRNLFIPEAVIFLRVSKEASSVFTLQGWIDDFVAWDEKARVAERGFSEAVVRMDPIVFRDIANVFVLYDAALADSDHPPTRGVDCIDLIRKDGRWWIASIVNDLPTPEHPVPQRLAP